MKALWSFTVAFVRFWYKFIIGDDATLAGAVAVGLVVTWALVRHGVSAWWLVPLVAVVAVSVSILRAPLAPAAKKTGTAPRPEEAKAS
jgi:hypothetical protein